MSKNYSIFCLSCPRICVNTSSQKIKLVFNFIKNKGYDLVKNKLNIASKTDCFLGKIERMWGNLLLCCFLICKQDKKSATNGTFEEIKEVGNPLFLSHKIDEKNS